MVTICLKEIKMYTTGEIKRLKVNTKCMYWVNMEDLGWK